MESYPLVGGSTSSDSTSLRTVVACESTRSAVIPLRVLRRPGVSVVHEFGHSKYRFAHF